MDTLAAIKQTFFQECEEQLVELETGLLAIEAGDHDLEIVNAVFRAVHSIKGGAGAFNLGDLVQFAHVFENAMELVRTGRLAPTPPVVKTMLRAADILADLVRAARADKTSDPARSAGSAAELAALSASATPKAGSAPAVAAAAAPPPPAEDEWEFVPLAVDLSDFADLADLPALNRFRIGFRPRPELYAKGNETAVLMRELAFLGTIEVTCDTSDLPGLPELDPEGAYLGWTVELETERDEGAIRDIFDFVEWDSTLVIEQIMAPVAVEAPSAAEAEPAETEAPRKSNVTALPLPAGPPAAAEAPAGDAAGTEHKATVQASPTIRGDL